MSWTANNKYHCEGSITSGLTLSIDNGDGGTVPSDMSLLTYNDETYNDSTYEITAIYEGTFESSFSVNDLKWTSVGDSNDIKYQVATSDDGVTYSEYSTLADAIGTTQIAVSAAYFKFRLIWYSSAWTDSDSFVMDSIVRKFTVFANGDIINANQWMSNFYVVGQDHLLPRGGTSLDLTTSVYDIGSSSHGWNNVYINNLFSITSIKYFFNLVSDIELSATANRIEISNLGTASDTTYYLKCRFINETISSDDILLFFNGDSATNYADMLILTTSGADGGTIRNSATSGLYIGECDSGTSYLSCVEGALHVHHSNYKFLSVNGTKGIGGNTITTMFVNGGIWNNETTVTSIQFYCASKFGIGTEVKLWRKL